MKLYRSNIYLAENHIEELKSEPEYVKKRYFAIAKTLSERPFHITRKSAAEMIGRSLRHFYRLIKRYQEEGISGLRFKSKRPKTSPNKISQELESIITEVRNATGFGTNSMSVLVNESQKRQGSSARVYGSLNYNVLKRNGIFKREKQIKEKLKFFDWKKPNRLIQADLTKFNGVPILTMLDDGTRKGWSCSLKNQKDTIVVDGMKKLIPYQYDNLLTDNGSQFSRRNSVMRKYCEKFVKEKHIWTSIHHPQTMGKLSAYQKNLKRFLKHRMGNSRNIQEIERNMKIFNLWYNHGRKHRVIQAYPEEKYSGKRDLNWYGKLVKMLKLENILTV